MHVYILLYERIKFHAQQSCLGKNIYDMMVREV